MEAVSAPVLDQALTTTLRKPTEKSKKKPNPKRSSWFGVRSASPPTDTGLLHQMALAGVSEVRWCADGHMPGMQQLFLYSHRGFYINTWERHCLIWKFSPSFNEEKHYRREKLWMLYTQPFPHSHTELAKNVIVLERINPDGTPRPSPWHHLLVIYPSAAAENSCVTFSSFFRL